MSNTSDGFNPDDSGVDLDALLVREGVDDNVADVPSVEVGHEQPDHETKAEDLSFLKELEKVSEEREEQNFDLNENFNQIFDGKSLESMGLTEESVNQMFQENGFNTDAEKIAALKTFKMMNPTQSPEEVQRDMEEQQRVDDIMKNEYSKLNQEEFNDIKNVIDYVEKNIPVSQQQVAEQMLSTADGYRMMRNMMSTSMRGNIPNLHSNEANQNVKPFDIDEYSDFTDKINKAGENFEFDKVESLKKQMKREIANRGTAQIKKDILPYL